MALITSHVKEYIKSSGSEIRKGGIQSKRDTSRDVIKYLQSEVDTKITKPDKEDRLGRV
jgi:hypothetical protein